MKKIFVLLLTVIGLLFSTVYSEAKNINSSNAILVAGIQSARQTDNIDEESMTKSTREYERVEVKSKTIIPLILINGIIFLALIFYVKFFVSSLIRKKVIPVSGGPNRISTIGDTNIYKEPVNKNIFKTSRSSDDDIRDYERERKIGDK